MDLNHSFTVPASIAGLFLTTEAVVADKPEPAPAMPGADGGMGGMDF